MSSSLPLSGGALAQSRLTRSAFVGGIGQPILPELSAEKVTFRFRTAESASWPGLIGQGRMDTWQDFRARGRSTSGPAPTTGRKWKNGGETERSEPTLFSPRLLHASRDRQPAEAGPKGCIKPHKRWDEIQPGGVSIQPDGRSWRRRDLCHCWAYVVHQRIEEQPPHQPDGKPGLVALQPLLSGCCRRLRLSTGGTARFGEALLVTEIG